MRVCLCDGGGGVCVKGCELCVEASPPPTHAHTHTPLATHPTTADVIKISLRRATSFILLTFASD